MNSNPSLFKGSNRPVENIELTDIQSFIQRINSQTSLKFRLPTVQEWAFAASGGIEKKGFTYSGGNLIGNCAWYEENSAGETKPVGSKSGNELGIRDMSGNVWERCQGNVMCGGSYLSTSSSCTINSIKKAGSGQKDNTGGFRLVIGD